MSEKQIRSLAKTLTWRVIASLTTTLIVFILTGKLKLALSAGALDAFSKMFLYYFHERVWVNVEWGRIHPRTH